MRSSSLKFRRSVNIAHDSGDPSSFIEYRPNATANAHLREIVSNLSKPNGDRAWSLSGPYGSGKSAFLLHLSRILRGQTGFTDYSVGTWDVHPIVCRREPLGQQIAGALGIGPLEDLLPHLSTRIAAAQELGQQGVVLILDELNRVLGYMVDEPGKAELGVLQDLAELADRDDGLLLITSQHVSFGDYVGTTDTRGELNEWRKIQGRFHDLSFFVSQSELLAQIADALEVEEASSEVLRRVQQLRDSTVHTDETQLQNLERVGYVDPVLMLVLASAFRSALSQNQRSVYTFIDSEEDHGLRRFIASTSAGSKSGELYELPRFFEYLLGSYGPYLFSSGRAHHWNEVTARLDSLAGGADLDRNIVQAVFLLNEFGGPIGIGANESTLEIALGSYGPELIRESLAVLTQSGVLRKRAAFGDYALVGTSGYNLERALKLAGDSYRDMSFTALVQAAGLHVSSRISRRHYAETGNLRRVERRVISIRSLDSYLPDPDADLTELFIVDEASAGSEQSAIERARGWLDANPESLADHIVAILTPSITLTRQLRALLTVRHVLENDVELNGDPVALLEAQRYLDGVENRTLKDVGGLLGVGGYQLDPSLMTWPRFHPATPTTHELRQFEDELLQNRYAKAPRIFNELLNRSVVSSAAAKGRRTLIERMLKHSSEKGLGIQGYPPEYGMYQSFLLATGVHRQVEEGRWKIVRPEGSLEEIWNAIDEVLAQSASRVPVSAIFDDLQRPPYGIASGPLTVFFTAYMVSEGENFALYEQDTFVPLVGPEVLERLQRNPERFSARRVQPSSAQKRLLEAYSRVLNGLDVSEGSLGSVVGIARELILKIVTLPQYTQKTRAGLCGPHARQLREVIIRSQDPQELLLNEIPGVLGVDWTSESSLVSNFEDALMSALQDLLGAHERLLQRIQEIAERAFGVTGAGDYPLAEWASGFQEFKVSGRAGLVLGALRMPAGDWRENLGRAVLAGKPPSAWNDRDEPEFGLEMRRNAAILLDLVALKAYSGDGPRENSVAIVTLADGRGEVRQTRAVTSVGVKESEKLGLAVRSMVSTLDTLGLTREEAVSVLLELALGYGETSDAQ